MEKFDFEKFPMTFFWSKKYFFGKYFFSKKFENFQEKITKKSKIFTSKMNFFSMKKVHFLK